MASPPPSPTDDHRPPIPTVVAEVTWVSGARKPLADLPTMTESNRSFSVVHLLQGYLLLLVNHWMKAIWLPSDSVDLPESFSSSSSSLPVEIELTMHHGTPHSIQPSQICFHFLLETLSLVQGPPGIGKTIMITAYVTDAICSGQGRILLTVRSNVAVGR